MAARERAGVALAATAVLLLVLWLVALQPAWRTLRAAPAQHAALDAQLDAMQRWATEAKAVQGAPKITLGDATKALEQASAAFGPSGELRVQGDRATLRLRGASGDAVARWLPQVREQARALPIEVKLTRAAKPPGAAAAAAADWAWDGSIVLAIAAQ
jgi:general secretion pathway protein M